MKIGQVVTVKRVAASAPELPRQGVVEAIFPRFVLLHMMNRSGKQIYRETFNRSEVQQ